MSATIVSTLYDAIINDVVNQSRADFQDDGIDEATLQDFKTRWVEKIAATGATVLPDASEPVKPESTNDSNGASASPQPFPQGGNALAAMRAAQQIQQLQARSNGSIQQHQADTAVAKLMQQAQQSGGFNLPSSGRGDASNEESLDGVEIKQEPDLPQSMNPADMMLPQSPSKKRTLSTSEQSNEKQQPAPKPKKVKAPRSDIDLDDEAINSDLDDSDDDALRADGDEGDEGDVQTVLCLYDKVQRTKNKWKCVLKDGIVNVNGRDFAFTKANGEFEW